MRVAFRRHVSRRKSCSCLTTHTLTRANLTSVDPLEYLLILVGFKNAEDAAEEFSDAVEETPRVLTIGILAKLGSILILHPILIHLRHGFFDHRVRVCIDFRDGSATGRVNGLGLVEVCVGPSRHFSFDSSTRKDLPLCGTNHTLITENVDDFVVERFSEFGYGLLHRHVRTENACREVHNALDPIRGFFDAGLPTDK